MLDVHRLVLLREVHVHGSITAAARALSYSHSAVSQQLSLLDKEAGVPLLEKVGRGVRLTPAAQSLVHRAEDILAILERAESDLANSDTAVRGTLRLAAFTTISRSVVPEVIATLQHQHPELDVRYQQAEPETGLPLLSSRRIDVLVADSYPGTSDAVPPDLHADLLLRDPIRAYLPAGTEIGSVDALRSLRWVSYPTSTEAYAWARALCQRYGFEPDVAYESPDLLFHLRAVRAGLAAAFLPDLLVNDLGGSPVPTKLIDPQQYRHISMLCRAGSEQRPSIVACREAFAQHLTSGVGGSAVRS
jgi:molybdate transport repressor ModE-like protein